MVNDRRPNLILGNITSLTSSVVLGRDNTKGREEFKQLGLVKYNRKNMTKEERSLGNNSRKYCSSMQIKVYFEMEQFFCFRIFSIKLNFVSYKIHVNFLRLKFPAGEAV
jgi:hypothetical protein